MCPKIVWTSLGESNYPKSAYYKVLVHFPWCTPGCIQKHCEDGGLERGRRNIHERVCLQSAFQKGDLLTVSLLCVGKQLGYVCFEG